MNLEHIKSQLYNLYFSVFKFQDSHVKRIDESILLYKYKKFLRQYSKKSAVDAENSKLLFDYSIHPNDASTLKFDVAWKSSNCLHLVKPVSFDLRSSDPITKKAYQNSGQFIDLEDFALKNAAQFDLILAKPKLKALFKVYDNAIRILNKPTSVKIIELDQLDEYSKATVLQAAL